MNLKYSQIEIVVTSSKYCVKIRNESCVPFLSNCNTFIQSLQLKVFAGMEDVGREVPQGSSGYREDDECLREEASPSLAPSLVLSKPREHSVIGGVHRRALPGMSVEAEDHFPLVLLLFLLFLFRTASTKDPASHLPDISSETLCWPTKPYGSILPLRISSVRSLLLKDRVRK